MLRSVIFLLGLLFLSTAGFFGLAPTVADRMMNKIVPARPSLQARPADVLALHKGLNIVDLHSDSLLWRRDLLRGTAYGHIDLPRLEQGHVALQIFSSVTKSPKGLNYDRNSSDSDSLGLLVRAQLQPGRTWNSLLARSLHHADKLQALEDRADGRLRIIRWREDLSTLLKARSSGAHTTGAMLSVEGLHNIEGALENVDMLYDKGFRMLGLTHFFDNEVAGSVAGEQKYGLTPLGRKVVTRMEQRGMIVDLAHSSHKTIADVLAMATRPVVFSHGGVKATCNNNRNLSDDEIRGIAKTGGLIAIGYWDAAVCDSSPRGIARAMTHVKNLVGVQHTALGSDFDGAVHVPFDTAQLVYVTQALVEAGWPEADIRAAMGGNALRVFAETLPQKPTQVMVR
jgi:membrane dipeptidase